MTSEQVRRLKARDRVRSLNDGSEGTVIGADACAVRIRWDDETIAALSHAAAADLLGAAVFPPFAPAPPTRPDRS